MVGSSVDAAADGTKEQRSWRDELCLRAAKASVPYYAIGIVVLVMTVHGRWPRIATTAAGLVCCFLVGVLAFTGRTKGRLRPWFVVAPAVIASLAGFGLLGFLAVPVVTLTVTLGGLLLGRRDLTALLAIVVPGIGVIAWAKSHSVITAPGAHDDSMMEVMPWIGAMTLMFLGIGLLGALLVDVISRMEKSVEQTRLETDRRERAELASAHAATLSLANKQLETIGQLATGIAHDFNNNLAAIMGSAELMKDELRQNKVSPELVDDILLSTQRAAQLPRQLLVYSRKAQVAHASTDLHELIDNTVAFLRRSIDPKVQIETCLSAENAYVLADASLLDNALLNLLVNARDAMPAGGTITILTSSHEVTRASAEHECGLLPGMHVLIEVLDTGEGIAAEVLPKIFEPFFTTKAVGKGTGLGLAAVSGTVKSLNGSVAVESVPGQGAAFRILLPCDAPKDSRVSQVVTQLTRGVGRVLLVDDDILVTRATAATLRRLGYEVTVANDGVHAIEVFKRSPDDFHLVILDLQMPRMDGETTYGELRRLAPAVPILIWSGYNGELDVEAILPKGAVGFIQKPYGIVEFSQVVSDAINGRATERASAGSA